MTAERVQCSGGEMRPADTAVAADLRSASDGRLLSPVGLFELQSSIGNGAVARLVASLSAPRGGSAAIQRARITVGDPFGTGRKEIVAAAVQRAKKLIQDAIAYLQALKQDDDDETRRDSFELYFGDYDAPAVDEVIGIYQAALAVLDTVEITDHVESMDVGDTPGAHAWSKVGDKIYLMTTFWSSDDETKTLTLLHEATHVARDTNDDSTFGEAKALRLAASNAKQARTCAYNFEYFAQYVQTAEARKKAESEKEPEGEVESESSEDEADEPAAGERAPGDDPVGIWEDERRTALEMNRLSRAYEKLSPDAKRQRARLQRKWEWKQRVLFHSWQQNSRAYTLYLSTSAIGVQIEVPKRPE